MGPDMSAQVWVQREPQRRMHESGKLKHSKMVSKSHMREHSCSGVFCICVLCASILRKCCLIMTR